MPYYWNLDKRKEKTQLFATMDYSETNQDNDSDERHDVYKHFMMKAMVMKRSKVGFKSAKKLIDQINTKEAFLGILSV